MKYEIKKTSEKKTTQLQTSCFAVLALFETSATSLTPNNLHVHRVPEKETSTFYFLITAKKADFNDF